jgi:hypothetical protein
LFAGLPTIEAVVEPKFEDDCMLFLGSIEF